MFWQNRRVLRDRAAGMVFDWRRGHGSAHRLLIAALLAVSCVGALLAYVQIRKPEPVAAIDDQIDLTIVDLDAERNRWLAELIDRETLFHRRWDVSDPSVLASAIAAALAVESPRTYQATLREIVPPEPSVSLTNLPGLGPEVLPLPAAVESMVFVSPPVNWWVEVRAVDGPRGLVPFSFAWPDPESAGGLSEGEVWTVLVGVNWRGEVVVNEPAIKSSNSRTPVILARCRKLSFDPLPKKSPLRWWKLEARLVNRPLSE